MVGLKTPTICWVTPFFEAENSVFFQIPDPWQNSWLSRTILSPVNECGNGKHKKLYINKCLNGKNIYKWGIVHCHV
jgi:hypothetical protein